MNKSGYLEDMSRISIEVSPEQHKQIKALAALKGQSIKDFVMEKVLPINSENDDPSMSELKDFLRERLRKSRTEPWSKFSFDEIVEDEFRKLDTNAE